MTTLFIKFWKLNSTFETGIRFLWFSIIFCLSSSVAFGQTCTDFYTKNERSIIGRLLAKRMDPETLRLSETHEINRESIRFHFDPTEAFQERWHALTGETIPDQVFKTTDLTWSPSFSNAPMLDLIVVTTLQTRYDFTSNLLAQALEFHARRGTKIIYGSSYSVVEPDILTSKVKRVDLSPSVQKEINFVKRLKAAGIDIHFLSLQHAHPNRFGKWSSFLNGMHAKSMILYSAQNPSLSRAFSGGRNNADTYFMRKAPNLDSDPKLLQYGKDTNWLYVTDFDISIQDPKFVRTMIYNTSMVFPEHSRKTIAKVLSSETETAEAPLRLSQSDVVNKVTKVKARNFTSLAGRDLEQLYVEAINTAQTSIKLMTPYLNPPKAILNALKTASQRGVKIEITTNLNLAGDDYPKWMVDAMEAFSGAGANVLSKKISKSQLQFRSWTRPDLFHLKILQIDDSLLFATSVNMGQRSFTKDIENGVIFEGRDIVTDFNQQVVEKEILPNTEVIDDLKKVRWQYRALFNLFGSYF